MILKYLYSIFNTGVLSFNGLTGAVQGVSAAVGGTGISVSGATGSVTITNTGVLSFNGSTGAVGISAGSNVTIIQTGNTYTISSSQINIDGGRPDEIYGGIETINGGNVNGI